jgi:hypothetical protein
LPLRVRFLVASGLAVALSVSLPTGSADAARSRRQVKNQTRTQGGPSAIGGVVGTGSSQMVRVQQQRARKGAAGQQRMSPREQVMAARDRQLGIAAGSGPVFSSRHEAALYTRLKARTIQLRTFAVAVAAGIGGGFLAKLITVAGAARGGFHELGSLANDPNFGNVIAQVVDGHFAVGAMIGAGVALVAGSLRAAQLRRRADAIERGDYDLDRVD